MQHPTETDEVLTIDQAAAVLGIAPRTLRRWVNERGIPYVKIGGVLRIMRSSLLGWIRRQETVAGGDQSGG